MHDTTIAAGTPAATNRYLAALRGQLCEHNLNSIDKLVIAHDEPMLNGRLGEAVAPPSAILPLAQSAWNFDDPQQAEAVAWAVDEAEVETIILAGHSHGMSSAEAARQFFERAQHRTSRHHNRPTESLFQRVTQAQDSLQRTKTLFADHFYRLQTIPAVARQTRLGQLRLIGLFYLAESGVFLAYEPDCQTFRPLLEAASGRYATTGGERYVYPWSSSDA